MSLLIQYTLIFASVLMLVALGGCFAEHSGVINLGLEGIMVIGALGGALVMRLFPDLSTPMMILGVVLGAVIFGLLYSALLGVACINFKADQTIVGTALNMLATAAATVFVKAMNASINPDDVSSTIQYVDQKKNFLLYFGDFEFNWFMLIAVIALQRCRAVIVPFPFKKPAQSIAARYRIECIAFKTPRKQHIPAFRNSELIIAAVTV